jgi:hypothetical protein
MTFDEWEEKYKPIGNMISNNTDNDGRFETYGEELGFVWSVQETEPKNVWTMVEGDDGWYIINGYHLVNRVAYFVTELPFEGDFLEVVYMLDNEADEDQDWIDHCLITANGTEEQIEAYIYISAKEIQ